jgi:hypothetical protein
MRFHVLVLLFLLAGCGPGIDETFPPSDTSGQPGDTSKKTQLDARPAPDKWVCRDFYALNLEHYSQGRAHYCGAEICADGSNDNLGPVGVWTTIREVSPGYFKKGKCP